MKGRSLEYDTPQLHVTLRFGLQPAIADQLGLAVHLLSSWNTLRAMMLWRSMNSSVFYQITCAILNPLASTAYAPNPKRSYWRSISRDLRIGRVGPVTRRRADAKSESGSEAGQTIALLVLNFGPWHVLTLSLRSLTVNLTYAICKIARFYRCPNGLTAKIIPHLVSPKPLRGGPGGWRVGRVGHTFISARFQKRFET